MRVSRKFGVWTKNKPFEMNDALRSITSSKICIICLEDDETKKYVNFATVFLLKIQKKYTDT